MHGRAAIDIRARGPSNVVNRHIRNLRAKLQNNWRPPRYIATIPGQGYRFIPTDTGEGPALSST